MKIFVESRQFIEKMIDKNPEWHMGKHIISIFSKGDVSPLPDRFNILKLEFDDVAERDIGNDSSSLCVENLIFFNEDHAKAIHKFIKPISADDKKLFFIHCDAGVSRSGAVGLLLNEGFNKFLKRNQIDDEAFKMNNKHILPNPLVVRLLKKELFGMPFRGIEVNDYTFNEDGDRIDHIELI